MAWAVGEAREAREVATKAASSAAARAEEAREAATTEEGSVAVAMEAAAAFEDRETAQQVEGTAVAGGGMAAGSWAAQQAAEEFVAATVGWEAAVEKKGEMVGREAAAGRAVAQRYGRSTVPCRGRNPILGRYSTAARWAAAKVEVERQRRGSLRPNYVVEEAFPEERVAAVMVAAARAVMRVVRGVAVAKVASRALAMREAASTVAETEAVLEDQVAARGWAVMVEATEMVAETRVAWVAE